MSGRASSLLLSRRASLGLVAGAAALSAVGPAPAQEASGELTARPHPPTVPAGYSLKKSEEAVIHVPGRAAGGAFGLALLCHGTHYEPESIVGHFTAAAEERGFIILAPKSCGETWDVMSGPFGPDVRRIDRWLQRIFDWYPIDPVRIAIAGWSDGGSYALSLGVANGDLFHSIAAFAPGVVRGARRVGKPAIFIGHGTEDQNLKVDETSRLIVPSLRAEGYPVTYVEFPGTHTIPDEIWNQGIAALRL